MTYLDNLRRYDYLHWENPQAVTITLKHLAETVTIDTDYGFMADPAKVRQFFGSVALQNEEVGWIIPVEVLAGETLELGDTIGESDGTTWTINRASKVRLDTQWIVTAVKNVG